MTNMTFTKGVGTPAYMAPEMLKREYYKKEADIYSFAITMLETMIWDNAFPKTEFLFPWDIADYVSSGRRPNVINKVENVKMKEIIESCYCQDPKDRLCIEDVVKLIEKEWMIINNINSSESSDDTDSTNQSTNKEIENNEINENEENNEN